MKDEHLSSSKAQVVAEKEILIEFCKRKNIQLDQTPIYLKDCRVEIDGQSLRSSILVEVYSHVGKLSSSQIKKVLTDVLKMLFVEDSLGKKFRKKILFLDEEARNSFLGNKSWRANTFKVFGIETEVINIPKIRELVLVAQERQGRKFKKNKR
ncbi:MAG: hypothetical protein V2A63_00960 [Patescibacteria group bacterium]